jgi:hypothetical protein
VGTTTEEAAVAAVLGNYFQLLEIDGNWKIVAKLFGSH